MTTPQKQFVRPELSDLPSVDREAQILWGLRWHIAKSKMRQVMQTGRLRGTLVLVLSVALWVGLYIMFREGFSFVVDHVGSAGAKYHAQTIKFVFHLFFASLNVMLVFSAGIIIYGSLFRAPETQLLLSLPLRTDRLLLYKFQEAVVFSSWGFLLLASPMLIAYGVVVNASWYYYALLGPLMLSFVYIPCAIGTIACVFIVRHLPRLVKFILFIAAGLSVAFAARAIWQTVNTPQEALFGYEWFQETLQRFQFTQHEWLPSAWLSNGLLEAARPSAVEMSTGMVFDTPALNSILYLALLISNALVCAMAMGWIGRKWLRTSFSRLHGRGMSQVKTRGAILDRLFSWLVFAFPKPVQMLLLKDWKLFRRDPVQWSQFLIFFGLLGLYLLNIDRFNNPSNDVSYIAWVSMVSFLNLVVVGLILSTFTTRFIYPMISLEGNRFWVLGLLPIDRDTILWSKFLFAGGGSLLPCSLLILVSDYLLHVSFQIVIIHQVTCAMLCIGLSAIAVGCGAIMPNMQEVSPSKIAAGFGGTLNLVLSALYILAIVVLCALPSHFEFIASKNELKSAFFNPETIKFWKSTGLVSGSILAIIATAWPLRQGLRAFRKMEFY